MTTRNEPRERGSPRSAGRHDESSHAGQHLGVLTRANHDMRSPLSVILGVFELLEDTTNLSEGERRYLRLGMTAAEELLSLADAIRLYSAIERDLVSVDTLPVDLAMLAEEQLQATLGPKGIELETRRETDAKVQGDIGYLRLALAPLIRHLAAHVSDSDAGAIAMCQRADDAGCVWLQVGPPNARPSGGLRSSSDPMSGGHEELGVLNAMRLIELMGGSATVSDSEPVLAVILPAAAA